jgi:hypothetical protein
VPVKLQSGISTTPRVVDPKMIGCGKCWLSSRDLLTYLEMGLYRDSIADAVKSNNGKGVGYG